MKRPSVLLLLAALAWSLPVSAQVNPFADDDEAAKGGTVDGDDSSADEKSAGKKTRKKGAKKKGKADDEETTTDTARRATSGAVEAGVEAQVAANEEANARVRQEELEEAARREAETRAAEQEAERLAEEEAAASALAARVRLSENYSSVEFIATGVVLVGGLTVAVAGPNLFGEPEPSMTAPRLGSIDYKLSIRNHGDLREGSPFAFGLFDVAGIAVPAALGGFYLVSGLYLWAMDDPMLGSQSINIDHSMVAMAETVGWTALAAGITRLLVGRERPYSALGRDGYGDADALGANGSFFSTTTAINFGMATFAVRDFADNAQRNGTNVLLGTVVPAILLYGTSAMVAYSSIYDQQHFFSDVAVGALVGSLIGNLVYSSHFEADGEPRRRHSEELSVVPVLLPSDQGTALGGMLTRRF